MDGTTATPQGLSKVKLVGKIGAGFALTATPHLGHGDSHANIRVIDGTATDLGTLSIDGDVHSILAGSGAVGTVGLQSFTALSVGRANAGDGDTGGVLKNVAAFKVKTDVVNATLFFTGGVKTLTIGGNLEETIDGEKAFLDITGDVGALKIGGSIIARNGADTNLRIQGKAGTVTIGGSVIGGTADLPINRVQIQITKAVQALTIGGDLTGRGGDRGGRLELGGVATLKIGGSIIGGSGNGVGTVYVNEGPVKTITVGGDVAGGSATGDSGVIQVVGNAGSVKIGGSLIGGTGNSSGLLVINGDVGSIAIGRNFIGGNSTGNAMAIQSGAIVAVNLGSLVIGGDFIGGRVEGTGSLDHLSSAIAADGTIGAIKIGGSILGDPGHRAYITAGGFGTTGAVNAIKSLTVKGSVQSASIVTGYDTLYSAQNTDSGIGSVTIGGDLAGSYVMVGLNSGTDGIPGNSDDETLSTIATITNVKVGGAFTGLAGSATSHLIFGPKILKLAIGQATYTQAQVHDGLVFNSIGLAVASSV